MENSYYQHRIACEKLRAHSGALISPGCYVLKLRGYTLGDDGAFGLADMDHLGPGIRDHGSLVSATIEDCRLNFPPARYAGIFPADGAACFDLGPGDLEMMPAHCAAFGNEI